MIHSLRYQFKQTLELLVYSLFGVAASQVYAWVFFSGDGFSIASTFAAYLLLALAGIAYYSNIGQLGQLALSFGASRRNWYLASGITMLFYVVANIALLLFVVQPLNAWLFGGSAWDGYQTLPITAIALLLLCIYGSAMGYLSSIYGMRWAVILTLVLLFAAIAAVIFVIYSISMVQIIQALYSPYTAAVLFAVCALFYCAIWPLVRRMEVRG